jgi:hypothetical protein
VLLERWPATRTAARFGDALEVDAGTTAFVTGAVDLEDGVAHARSGEVRLLVRARDPRVALRITAEGDGTLRIPGHAPLDLRGRIADIDVPLTPLRHLIGRRGVEEDLLSQTFQVEAASPGSVLFRFR